VVQCSAAMLKKLFEMNKAEIVNEMLELYRFIVDKYSCMNLLMPNGEQSVIAYLVSEMNFMFTNLRTWRCEQEAERPREEVLVVQTILRIMLQIVVRVPKSELP
jgi:hypothetical protein